jgi:hypothetical protein
MAHDVNIMSDNQQRARFYIRALLNSVDSIRYGSVCTSTESTPGKSRTIGVQLSPASAEA